MVARRAKVVTQEAETYLAQLCERLESAGQRARAHVRSGSPSAAVLDESTSVGASLIVMTTHGRTGPGRVLLGSVATDVVNHAAVPVLLIPPNADLSWSIDRPIRVLVPLDGSSHAETVLGPAGELADALHAEMLIVQVADRGAEVEAVRYL
jgi:nucleotide-binding universal stress UspA family protein